MEYQQLLHLKINVLFWKLCSTKKKCLIIFVETCYKESYSYDSLLTLHKFFSCMKNIFEVFYAVKSVIATDLYKLEEGEKEILLIITCLIKKLKWIFMKSLK